MHVRMGTRDYGSTVAQSVISQRMAYFDKGNVNDKSVCGSGTSFIGKVIRAILQKGEHYLEMRFTGQAIHLKIGDAVLRHDSFNDIDGNKIQCQNSTRSGHDLPLIHKKNTPSNAMVPWTQHDT